MPGNSLISSQRESNPALEAWQQAYQGLNSGETPSEAEQAQALELIGRIQGEGITDPQEIAEQLAGILKVDKSLQGISAAANGRHPLLSRQVNQFLAVLASGEHGSRLTKTGSVSAGREGPSTLGTTLKIAYQSLRGKLGLTDESPLPDRVARGLDTLAHTTFVEPQERPATLEEAQERYDELNKEEIKATRAYESQQIDRMTTETAQDYLEARNRIVSLYQGEKEVLDAWLKKAKQIGYPDPNPLQQAKISLDRAILRNEALAAKGIGPAEFQILMKKRDYEVALKGGSKEAINFRRSLFLGQERMYVLETFAYRISQLKKTGFSQKEKHDYQTWRASEKEAARLEKLGIEARGVYDRLIEGSELHAGDYDLLRTVRTMAFPFELGDADISIQITEALRAQDAAQKAFDEHSKKFISGLLLESLAVNKKAEEIALERDLIDFNFQVARLESEFKRLKESVIASGGTLHPDDEKSFQEKIKNYKESFETYRKYHEAFFKGEDIKARENGRNKWEKNVLFQLAFGAQWQLFELYKHYDVKDKSGKQLVPSCLSLAYINALRVMASSYDKGAMKTDNVATYFRGLHAQLKEAYAELGLKVPDTDIKVGGRDLLDLAAIDNLAAEVASGASDGIADNTFIHGAHQLMYLMQEQPAHQAALMAAGAERVFEGFEDHVDMSRNAILFRSNHTGIREFWEMLKQGWLGVHLPQQAQGGLKNIPIFGDYLFWRTVLLAREEGAADANKKILNFLRREMAILSYTSGTRMVSASGGNAYINYSEDPSQILARRIITDRFTAGQEAKILLDYAKESQGLAGVLVANIVHNTGLALPEPTWFLSGGVAEMLLGNLDPETMINFWDKSIPTHLNYGTVISSLGYKNAGEWKETHPDLFKHPNGEPLSAKAADYMALQLNAAVMTIAMRFDAAQIDLEKPQPETQAQLKLQAELAAKQTKAEDKEVHEASVNPMLRHLDDRMKRIQKARIARRESDDPSIILRNPKNQHLAEILAGEVSVSTAILESKKEEREDRIVPIETAHPDTREILNGYLTDQEAAKVLENVFKITDDPKQKKATINGKALPYMLEAVQRGARAAKEGGLVAFDLDKVMWDHFFPVSSDQFLSLARQELEHFVSSQGGENGGMESDKAGKSVAGVTTGGQLEEIININPLWLAFVIGYTKANEGKAPVFFSSTMSARLQALVDQQDQSPLVKEFFRIIFPELKNDANKIKKALSADSLVSDYKNGKIRIVTREVIAAHIVALMEKYEAAGFSTQGMSAAEKTDIEAILKSDGDVHLKLRSLVPYDVLIDDRKENAAEAAKHKGVTVVNPEPHASGAGSLYWTTDLETHINQRLGQGRSGKALTAMRLWQSSEGMGRHISIPRRYKVARISGLYDAKVRINYTREAARQGYEGPITMAKDTVRGVKLRMSQQQVRRELFVANAKRELTTYYQGLKADHSIPPGLIKMALSLVDISQMKKDDKGRLPEVKSDADLQALLAPLRYLPESEQKSRVIDTIKSLCDRELVDMIEKITPKEARGLKKIPKVYGKLAKFFTKQLPEMLQAMALSGQHVLGDMLGKELGLTGAPVKKWANIARLAMTHDGRLLIALSREMEDGKDRLTPNARSEAYGLAAQTVFNVLVKKYIDKTDLSEHIMEGEDQTSLKNKLHERRVEMAESLRDFVVNAGYAVNYGGKAWSHLKDFSRNFMDLFRSPLGEAARSSVWNFLSEDFLGAVFGAFHEQLEKQLKSGSDQTQNTLVAKALFAGLGDAFSDIPAVQHVLGYLDAVVDHKGFSGLVGEVVRTVEQVKKFKAPEVKVFSDDIAQYILEGSWQQAATQMFNAASTVYSKDRSAAKKEAQSQFDNIVGAAHMILAPKVESGIRLVPKPVKLELKPDAAGSVAELQLTADSDPIEALWGLHGHVSQLVFAQGMMRPVSGVAVR